LGAERRRVIRMVMVRGAALAVAGIIVGLAGAMAATRYLHSMLYGVTATDPVTLGAVGVILFVVALLASWLPARRAARVDPMVALRYE
ncbi:MAG: FtsX-like permease family protein, partial [Terriglobales bacterium]